MPVCAGSTGAAGPRLFTIHQVDICTNNLPKAHTWYVTSGLHVWCFSSCASGDRAYVDVMHFYMTTFGEGEGGSAWYF